MSFFPGIIKNKISYFHFLELCVEFMNLIAKTGVGRVDERITVRTFESYMGTFSRLVSEIIILNLEKRKKTYFFSM